MLFGDQSVCRQAVRHIYRRVSRARVPSSSCTMASLSNPSEHWIQVSNDRMPPYLPPYESIGAASVPLAEASRTMDSSHSEQNPNTEHRKSYVLSTSQASDQHGEIKGWPEQPRKLRDKTVLSVIFNISEVLIILAPAAFISLNHFDDIANCADQYQYLLPLRLNWMGNQ